MNVGLGYAPPNSACATVRQSPTKRVPYPAQWQKLDSAVKGRHFILETCT